MSKKEKKFMQKITDALIQIRKESGISQKEMADLLGTTQPSISVGESCSGWTSTKKIFEYANALNCDVSIIFTKKKS